MIKLLFICHGNIRCSPMAEFVMKDLVRQAGLAERFQIESAATSTEEIGNPVYAPVHRLLAAHGLDYTGKTARQMTCSDYDRFDLLLGMDDENLRSMRRLWPNDPQHKLRLLLEYTSRPGPVADPWYTRDFEAAWKDITEGCQGLLNFLRHPNLSKQKILIIPYNGLPASILLSSHTEVGPAIAAGPTSVWLHYRYDKRAA